jgi:hypothetical protein
MRRREFITLLGGAAAWPLAARAQQPDERARVLLSRILHLQAAAIAEKIDQFIEGVRSQVGWTVQLPWSPGTIEARRFDSLRLLRQAPAVLDLAQLDSTGKEQLRVSRMAMDVVAGKADFSGEPKFTAAVAQGVYYGPVHFREIDMANPPSVLPCVTLSVAGRRREAGVSVAEVSLKPVQEVVRLDQGRRSRSRLRCRCRGLRHCAFRYHPGSARFFECRPGAGGARRRRRRLHGSGSAHTRQEPSRGHGDLRAGREARLAGGCGAAGCGGQRARAMTT